MQTRTPSDGASPSSDPENTNFTAFHALIGAVGPNVQLDPDTAVELLTKTVTVPPAVSRWVEQSIDTSEAS
jgi:hypothetical protein